MTRRKSDEKKDLVAKLRRQREGRQSRSTYGKVKAARDRVKAALAPVEQQERVQWALTRLRSARGHLSRNKHDPVWQAAVRAREAEYERERAVLDRLAQQRAG